MSKIAQRLVGFLASLLSVHKSAGELIRTDGIYVSIPAFERLDQTWFRHYFIFYKDGTVRKGACKREFDVDELIKIQPLLGLGKYLVKDKSIRFAVRVPGYEYESSWRGTIEGGNIRFEIVKPDFEDIDGLYTFHQANSAPNKSSHSAS